MSDTQGGAPRRPRPKEAGERRWPMAAAVLTGAVLQLILPHGNRIAPPWIFPSVEVIFLIVLIIGDPGRIDRTSPRLRRLTIALIAVMTVANGAAAGVLVRDILTSSPSDTATILLGRGAAIWVTNIIVFSLWFWQLDRGGPAERAAGAGIRPSFAFPENATPELAPAGWIPQYPDYLYLAFTNATAFSPTDTLPVATWAKMTMMLESAVSLAVAILVVARAINILPQ
jgi:uncharacterized membrane protein